jgi:prepilin-type processing-associated H-X9-DG protein
MGRAPALFIQDDTPVTHNLMGWGIKAASGVLVNDLIERGTDSRVAVRLAEVRDGTSKTLMVSEHGDLMTSGGYPVDRWGTSQGHSFIMGHYGRETRQWNIVTVRYAINDRKTENVGVGDFDLNYGANKPLLSAHRGGVNGLYADGSVRFLAENMDLQVLWNASNRQDGNISQ